jgi:hypothetical protein
MIKGIQTDSYLTTTWNCEGIATQSSRLFSGIWTPPWRSRGICSSRHSRWPFCNLASTCQTLSEEARGISGTDLRRYLRKKYVLQKVSEGKWKSVYAEEVKNLLPRVKPRDGALETWHSVQSLRIVQGVVTDGIPQATPGTTRLSSTRIISALLAPCAL